MKIEDVFKLIDAGFTKEEIFALNTPEAAPAPEPDKALTEEPDKEPAPAPAPAAPEELANALNGILDSFKAVAKEIKSANIANSKMPEIKTETAEDIIASMLYPQETRK